MGAFAGSTRVVQALWHPCRLFDRGVIAVLAFVSFIFGLAPALADKRVALVIGNAHYQHAKSLTGPIEDVRVVAAALQAVGFKLSGGAALVDLDRAGLDRTVQQFGRDIADADVAFIYYAGHAVQLHGSSFLVPVDAAVSKETDLDGQALHVGLLLQQLEGSAGRLNMLVLDACHPNPFEEHGLNGLEPGLAPVHTPANTLVSYAAQPDIAVPETSDTNNLYAMTLALMIQRPGVGLFDVFDEDRIGSETPERRRATALRPICPHCQPLRLCRRSTCIGSVGNWDQKGHPSAAGRSKQCGPGAGGAL